VPCQQFGASGADRQIAIQTDVEITAKATRCRQPVTFAGGARSDVALPAASWGIRADLAAEPACKGKFIDPKG
jgi:hypothetical protein